jgi:hypothetical protein
LEEDGVSIDDPKVEVLEPPILTDAEYSDSEEEEDDSDIDECYTVELGVLGETAFESLLMEQPNLLYFQKTRILRNFRLYALISTLMKLKQLILQKKLWNLQPLMNSSQKYQC